MHQIRFLHGVCPFVCSFVCVLYMEFEWRSLHFWSASAVDWRSFARDCRRSFRLSAVDWRSTFFVDDLFELFIVSTTTVFQRHVSQVRALPAVRISRPVTMLRETQIVTVEIWALKTKAYIHSACGSFHNYISRKLLEKFPRPQG